MHAGLHIPACIVNQTFSPLGIPRDSCWSKSALNIRPQIVSRVEGIVAQEISGDVHLSTEARDFLRYIEVHGGTKKLELSSDVYQVEDTSIKPPDRTAARSRLLAFLSVIREKIPDVAAGMLEAYLIAKLGIS